MSITAETAKAHANDPAVLCCRAEEGITIEPANLEDPAIFDELVDSGLLSLDGCLTIAQVLGATLTKTSDSLSPLTPDNVSGLRTRRRLPLRKPWKKRPRRLLLWQTSRWRALSPPSAAAR